MAFRGNEMGMDFTYDNGTGNLDAQSPFARLGQNAQRLNATRTPSKRNSPQKHTTTPGRFPPSTTKPLPPPPPAAFNSLYNTPRTSKHDIDDSSAGETPKSPEQTDNDQTPDTMGRSNLSNNALTLFNDKSISATPGAERERGSPTKTKERPDAGRRSSFFGRFKNKWMSPGRGEIARGDHSHASSYALEKRVRKRRDKELQRHVARRRRHSISDSGEDDDLPTKSPRKISAQKDEAEPQQSWMSSLFSFISQYPTIPHILSWYAQLAFNVFIFAAIGYLLYCFWSAVQGDVDRAALEASTGIMAEMEACAHQYNINHCERATRAPAMESLCEQWLLCSRRDPVKVARAKVGAKTFAEIFNSFVDTISWKAMIFTLLIIVGTCGAGNIAFGRFRDKNAAPHYPPPNYYNQPPPPPTPHRSFSNENGFYGTPWQQMPQGLEPQPSAGYGQIEGRSSPVRKLTYN